MDQIALTAIEKRIMDNSHDIAKTKRRIKTVIIAGLMSLALTCYVAFVLKSSGILALMLIVYLIVTMIEKVGYGNAVIIYKGLIQKLRARIDELESGSERKDSA